MGGRNLDEVLGVLAILLQPGQSGAAALGGLKPAPASRFTKACPVRQHLCIFVKIDEYCPT
jgi:hypothetical protein